MIDKKKVIKGLEICSKHGSWHGVDCRYNEAYKDCPYRGCETGCVVTIAKDALALLKEQEPIKPTLSVDTWICSKCGHTLESQELIDDKENPQVLIHELYQYCPNCGMKVKWK